MISVDDLLVLKILAGRTKDLEDVRGILLRQGNSVDKPAVERRLRELEMLLEQSDLVAHWKKLARVTPKAKTKPRKR